MSSESEGRVSRSDGTVLADTDAGDPGEMENHLEREEMKAALQTGEGCATRFSQTLQKNMLYVAEKSADGQYVIRAAVAYAGLRDYLPRTSGGSGCSLSDRGCGGDQTLGYDHKTADGDVNGTPEGAFR